MAKKTLKKDWWKSKTLWAGIATTATGVGLLVSGEATLQEFVITFVGVLFSVLRTVTTEPIV